jgi:putative chitinase
MTPTLEHLMAAGIKREVAERWLPHVVKALAEFNITTPKTVAGWLAQTAHESGGYTMLEENLNYRAATMAVCWPGRFAEQVPDPAKPGKTKPKKDAKGANVPNKFALALERKPEAIANVVYANRMGNGPTESGEGFAFRGRGLKQLTGKDNHARCSKALNVDLVASPDLLLQPEYAARSAAWFWYSNGCNKLIDGGQCTRASLEQDFIALTKKINGGTIGLADRKARYDRVLAAIGEPATA